MSQSQSRKQEMMSNSRNDPELNPCLEESVRSMECLNNNQFQRNECNLYFENYKSCNKFWNQIRKDRKRQGIQPELPPSDERLSILKKHNMA